MNPHKPFCVVLALVLMTTQIQAQQTKTVASKIQPTSETAEKNKPKLIYFPLSGNKKVTDLLPLLNAEISITLQKIAQHEVLEPEALSQYLIMNPIENLVFCNKEAACIADMGKDIGAAWILFGDAKLSFDGSKLIVHIVLVDVIKRKIHIEKYGQFKKDKAVMPTGNLVRTIFGVPVVKPKVARAKPKPEPVRPKAKKSIREKLRRTAQARAVETPSAWSNPLTWTTGSLAVASFGAAILLGVLSQNKISDAEQLAVDGQPLQAQSKIHEAEDYALGANVAFGVGGAALTTAAVMLILDLTSTPQPLAPKVACLATGCQASVSLEF